MCNFVKVFWSLLIRQYRLDFMFDVIYEQRKRVFHRDNQTRKNNVNTRASVFVYYFRVFGYPVGTRASVVHMASQMNRDVTGCFGLLI